VDIAKLVARLELQSSQFQTELEKTNRKLLGFQKQSTRSLSNIEKAANSFRRVMTTAFAGLSIAAIGSFVKKTLDLGEELNNAAIKAGVSGEAFTQLAYAAKLTGVETGSLSTALRQMQRALSEARTGGKEQVGVFRALGIELKTLTALSPDKQFELIGDRINALRDPADKARAAMVLFGRAGADLLPLFEKGAEGIREAREEAVKFGQSFSTEQLKALDEAGDSVQRLTASFKGFATSLVAEAAPALRLFFDDLNSRISGGELDKLRVQLEFLRRQRDNKLTQGGRDFVQSSIDETARRLRLLEAPVTHSRGRNLGTKDIAPPGFQGDVQFPDLEVRATARKIELSAMEKFYADLQEMSRALTRQTVSGYEKQRAALVELYDSGRLSLEEFNQKNRELLDEILPSYTDLEMSVAFNSKKIFEQTVNEMTVFAEQASRNMQDAFADFLFDPFADGLDGMLKGFINVIRRMVAEAAAAKLFSSKSSGGLGFGDLLSGFFGGFLKFADGGRPPVGRPSIVGERGPELFVPDAAGTIIPNGAGGAVTVNYYNSYYAGSDAELRAMMPAIQRQTSDITVARIQDMRRRGK
jgi:hypothetical protein